MIGRTACCAARAAGRSTALKEQILIGSFFHPDPCIQCYLSVRRLRIFALSAAFPDKGRNERDHDLLRKYLRRILIPHALFLELRDRDLYRYCPTAVKRILIRKSLLYDPADRRIIDRLSIHFRQDPQGLTHTGAFPDRRSDKGGRFYELDPHRAPAALHGSPLLHPRCSRQDPCQHVFRI